jgi:hypothetical protein
VFLLLSLDSNGWFRHVATAAKQQSTVMYPSGIAQVRRHLFTDYRRNFSFRHALVLNAGQSQAADHVAAADLVDMLRDKNTEKPLGKL